MKELWEKMQKLVADMRTISDRAAAEKRDLTTEEDTEWQRIEAEYNDTEKRFIRARDLESRASRLEGYGDQSTGRPAPDKADTGPTADQRMADFRTYIKTGESRGLQYDQDTSGGFLAPAAFLAELIKDLTNANLIRAACRVLPFAGVGEVGAPALTTQMSDASWTAEVPSSALTGDTTMKFGKRSLRAHPLRKYIKISEQLLMAAVLSPEQIVREEMAEVFGNVLENNYLTGTGSGQPLGIFTASAQGISTSRDNACASQTVFTADEVIDTFHTLSQAYQRRATWIVSNGFISRLRKLKHSDGYLWQPAITEGVPGSILGRPYIMSDYCPDTYTTGLYIAAVGDMSRYWVLDSMQLSVRRLGEIAALTGEVGYLGAYYGDGMPVSENAFARMILA